MATNFNENSIVSSGGFKPSSKDTPLDIRTRVETEQDIYEIPNPYIGMIVYVKDTGKRFEILTLKEVDTGLTTKNVVDTYKQFTVDLEEYAKIEDVPTKVSELENDRGYAIEKNVDSKIEAINNTLNSNTNTINTINSNINTINTEIDNINTDLTNASENIEGSSISVDSKEGYLKDVEILGNTVQNQDNLADIRSVGDKLENQELYEIPVLCTNGLDSSDSNYKEHKLTILSPTPLEKVGDIADRIICKDGVWGVEKNVIDLDLDNIGSIGVTGELENTIRMGVFFKNNVILKPIGDSVDIICNLYLGKKNYTLDEEGVFIASQKENVVYFRINKSKLNNDFSESNAKKYILDNISVLKVNAKTPQFIPLPHDQQIKLRTFANKTNIHFLTEIEPTLKASVPKSIGATVNSHTEQIDNLSKELDRVKKLEESTTSTVTTESDFATVENTSNGYFEDVKIEGKTLVNLLNKNSTNELSNSNNGSLIYGVCTHIKPNTEYTIAYYVKASNTFTIPNNASARQGMVRIDCVLDDLSFTSNIYGLEGDLSTSYRYELAKFTTPSNSNIKRVQLQLRNAYTDAIFGLSSNTLTVKDAIILEGDHTQNPPEFFEGLKSVGQDVDDITIVTTNAPMFFGKGGKK